MLCIFEEGLGLCVSMEDEEGLDLGCVSQWRMRRV